jgi:hypothetical protein
MLTGKPVNIFILTVGQVQPRINCGYHLTPKEYFDQNGSPVEHEPKPLIIPKAKPVSYIPASIFKKSLKNYDQNHFVLFLVNRFGSETTTT